jgi:hypothetical protein
MTKKVAFGAKPQPVPPAARSADEWVQNHPTERAASEPMKRLTIDVPASLHTRIKIGCTLRGRKIADELRELLDRHFPENP